jgi:hypothetical protein
MAQKLCIYCHKVLLEGFDETERKYYEKGSKTLHTRERCELAKQGKLDTGNSQAATTNNEELVKKVDQILALVNEINLKISGQGSLDVEQ